MLSNKERVLISLAGKYIKVLKLKFFGNIPIKTVWKFEIFIFHEFLKRNDISEHPLDVITKRIINCNSSFEVKNELDQFVSELIKNSRKY